MTLIEKIRNAKSVAGVQRVISPVAKRRPLGRGAQRIVSERIQHLTEAGKLTNSRHK